MNNYGQRDPHEYEIFGQVNPGDFYLEDGSYMNAGDLPSQDRVHRLDIPLGGGPTDDPQNLMSFVPISGTAPSGH